MIYTAAYCGFLTPSTLYTFSYTLYGEMKMTCKLTYARRQVSCCQFAHERGGENWHTLTAFILLLPKLFVTKKAQ